MLFIGLTPCTHFRIGYVDATAGASSAEFVEELTEQIRIAPYATERLQPHPVARK